VRKRQLKAHDKEEGPPPAQVSDLVKEYHAVKSATEKLEQDGHMRELSVAFALGGLSLSFVFIAWRAFTRGSSFSRLPITELDASYSSWREQPTDRAADDVAHLGENEMAVPLNSIG
jgi:hypothetical protein